MQQQLSVRRCASEGSLGRRGYRKSLCEPPLALLSIGRVGNARRRTRSSVRHSESELATRGRGFVTRGAWALELRPPCDSHLSCTFQHLMSAPRQKTSMVTGLWPAWTRPAMNLNPQWGPLRKPCTSIRTCIKCYLRPVPVQGCRSVCQCACQGGRRGHVRFSGN